MVYSEAKLRRDGDEASCYFKPFLTGEASDRFLLL
jgi:hypothetical protein